MVPVILKALINNAALLLALSFVYEISYIIPIRNKKLLSIFSGCLIGLIGISVMMTSFELRPGLVFDTRSILMGVTALTFGPITGSIAAVITIIFRITQGGIGTPTGISAILLATVIGLLWRRYFIKKNPKHRLLSVYLFGITIHIAMLSCMFLMPWQIAIETVENIALPVMLIYPVGTVLLSLLLLRQRERNEALINVAEAEERYRGMFENNTAVMLIIDPENHRIIDANPAACMYYGWSHDEMTQMEMTDINAYDPDDDLLTYSKGGKWRHFFFRHRKANGDLADVEVYSSQIKLKGRILTHSIVHDISERVAADRALKESESRFRLLVESAPDAIFIISGELISFANKAALNLFGAENADQIIGTHISGRVHEDYHGRIRKRLDKYLIDQKPLPPTDSIFLKMNGSPVYADVTAFPIDFYSDIKNVIVIARDMTERRYLEDSKNEIEAQLRQQQKLESIGTLAGGVAHEINNPIYGIMNYAQLIYDLEEKGSKQAQYASEILHETERISTIVKNLLQFSRHEKQSHSYASVYDIINQTISLVNTIIKKDQIRLDIHLADDLPDMKCRSQQIQQVIMNLITNARDALNEKYSSYDEDKIIILNCIQVDYDERRWIRLTVEDHGIGIPINLREKIYEPFFSTKPKDIGTGLGLSISFGIIKDHHGKISIESQEGSYTKFTLDLPVDNGWQL